MLTNKKYDIKYSNIDLSVYVSNPNRTHCMFKEVRKSKELSDGLNVTEYNLLSHMLRGQPLKGYMLYNEDNITKKYKRTYITVPDYRYMVYSKKGTIMVMDNDISTSYGLSARETDSVLLELSAIDRVTEEYTRNRFLESNGNAVRVNSFIIKRVSSGCIDKVIDPDFLF